MRIYKTFAVTIAISTILLFQSCSQNVSEKDLSQNTQKQIIVDLPLLQPYVGERKKGFEGILTSKEKKLKNPETDEMEEGERKDYLLIRFLDNLTLVVFHMGYSTLYSSLKSNTSSHKWKTNNNMIDIDDVGTATIQKKDGTVTLELTLSKSIYSYLLGKKLILKTTNKEFSLDEMFKTSTVSSSNKDDLFNRMMNIDFSIFNSLVEDKE